MTKIGKKFKDSQWKAIAKLDETYDELALPEVTICLSNPYKSEDGSMLVKENFQANAYEQSEIIVQLGDHASVDNNKARSLSKAKIFETLSNYKFPS